MEHILIDGYNYLFRNGFSHNEESRNAFLAQLKVYGTGKNLDITVIFDGVPDMCAGPFNGTQTMGSRLKVRYSQGKDADSLIRAMIMEFHDKKSLTVISSDRADIIGFAKKHRVKTLSSEAFHIRLHKTKKRAGIRAKMNESEKPAASTREEIDYYLDKFKDGT